MWRLQHLEAENLCAFRTLDYTPVQGVTTLVFGDNRDNESQRSNGSGKSALIEAIAVGLTGCPLRKVRGEEIINDAADECRVRLTLGNDAAGEALVIERRIPRKGPSTVECQIVRGGQEVATDEAVQPSVDAYNRYILDKLGLTREELFNTFILSKYRYQDFLSASDTQKKEIINRFSNGILVDRAIEKVAEDIAPAERELQAAALEMASIDGRVEMLSEQIGREEAAVAEKSRSREERTRQMHEAIAAKRALIRECDGRLTALQERTAALEEADGALQRIEGQDEHLEGSLHRVQELFAGLAVGGLTDWNAVLERKRGELTRAAEELRRAEADCAEAALHKERLSVQCNALKEHYTQLCDENRGKAAQCERQLAGLERALAEAGSRLSGMRRSRRELGAAVEHLKGQLSGTIRCPACSHEFLLADKTLDIAAAREELRRQQARLQESEAGILACNRDTEEIERQQDALRRSKRALTAESDAAAETLCKSEGAVRDAAERLHKAEQRQRRLGADITALQEEMEGIRRKLFDEAFALVDDACRMAERQRRQAEEEIHAARSAIATLQETLAEMAGASAEETVAALRASLREYRRKSNDAAERKTAIESRLHRLQEQQERFVQFKSYLAGTKIEALNRITNEFLESIGSDIRIRLSGFTMLRTGKLREKISASLIRDGVDCGSFGKFSAGEAARVHLATILAMQRLVNGGCDGDKGLDLLVLDELLDAMDESGLASTFTALNRLGITSLVVSHGNIAEGYAHKLVIVKEHGESRIG